LANQVKVKRLETSLLKVANLIYESALSSSHVSVLYIKGIAVSPISGTGSSGLWTIDNIQQDSVDGQHSDY
jgi:hypothetical protein